MLSILADECVHSDLTEAVQRNGFPIVTAKSLGLSGKSDEEIFDYACEHGFVILTFDRGFGNIFRFDHSRSLGVMVILLAQMTKAELLTIPIEFLKHRSLKELNGKLVIIGKTKIRITQHPGFNK